MFGLQPQQPQAEHSAVFPTSAGSTEAQKIPISFLNSSRSSFMPISVLADSGSDITLLSREDGERLGFNPDSSNDKFGVGGVGAGALGFSKFITLIKIGRLAPIQINFGVSDKRGALRDNLLGRENVLSKFDVTYRENSVTFVSRGQKAMIAGMFTDGRGF